MPFIQTDTFTLRGYECDAFGRLSIPALMNLMQESANRNALDYGISMADLEQRGFGWMLMRFRLRMHKYPCYSQTIQLTTYPTAVEKYFIYRDFRVTDEAGNLLADATSVWLVFGMEKRTMVPLPDFIKSLNPPTDIDPLPKLLTKPDFQTKPFKPTQQKNVEVGWLNIDQNQHVNNVAYVEWLLEAMDKATLQTGELTEIDLVYRTESHWGDELQIQSMPETSNTFIHRIIHPESGKDVVLARSCWKIG